MTHIQLFLHSLCIQNQCELRITYQDNSIFSEELTMANKYETDAHIWISAAHLFTDHCDQLLLALTSTQPCLH